MNAYRFWRAMFPVDSRVLQGTLSAAVAPLAARFVTGAPAAGGIEVVVEVLCDEAVMQGAPRAGTAGPSLVLLSTVEARGRLKCRLGFSNDAVTCNAFRDVGFPIVGASLEYEEASRTLTIVSPHFGDSTAMELERELLVLKGLAFEVAGDGTSEIVDYAQEIVSPDGAQPDTLLRLASRPWTTRRSSVMAVDKPGTAATASSARFPDLWPVPTQADGTSTCGRLEVVHSMSHVAPVKAAQPRLCERKTLFVPSAYRFEDVETIGFRLDLNQYGAAADDFLAGLTEPLNFHLTQPHVATGFRYRAASRTVLIELLRYGRMRLAEDSPPLTSQDFQCQHELVLRLLVGRVDDDTSQARDPAVYVPAIFVDNPWSQVLGREVQGLDKRMAGFFAGNARLPLLSNGVVPKSARDTRPLPLALVDRIALASTLNMPSTDTLLQLKLPAPSEDWKDFEQIDLGIALGSQLSGGTRWQPTDFDRPEFRRSFARRVQREHVFGFRGIQASPIGDRPLPRTWISTNFEVEKLQIARPTGLALLTLQSPQRSDAPKAWEELCRLLGNSSGAQVALPTGDWYRLRCAMTMTIQDGLDW